MGKAADQSGAIETLELIKLAAIHHPCNHFTDIERRAQIIGNNAVELLRVVDRFPGWTYRQFRLLGPVEVGDHPASQSQSMSITGGIVVGDAGGAGVDIGPTQLFRCHHFTCGRFHQGRATQKDGALLPYNDALIRHRRYISATGSTGAHDHSDLRNACGRESGLVVEDAAKVFFIGEDFILTRQIGTARIYQIDTRQIVLPCNLLGTEMFFHCHREVGAALYRRIVGNDQALLTADSADACDDAGGRDAVVIHVVGGKLGELQKWRAGIQQYPYSFTGQQLTSFQVLVTGALSTTLSNHRYLAAQVINNLLHCLSVFIEGLISEIDLAVYDRHYQPPVASKGIDYSCSMAREMTIRWISLVPSYIWVIRTSR